jgi:hypothetical protein
LDIIHLHDEKRAVAAASQRAVMGITYALGISMMLAAARSMTMPRACPGRATSISCEKIERVRTIVHAQIRSISRELRSLGPRSQGETAYSPAF